MSALVFRQIRAIYALSPRATAIRAIKLARLYSTFFESKCRGHFLANARQQGTHCARALAT
jgi:hypothetical protein